MKKVIKLTESDLRRIVDRVVKENINESSFLGDISNFVYDKIVNLVKKIGSDDISDSEKEELEYELKDELDKNDIKFKDIDKLEKSERGYSGKGYSSRKNIIIGDSQVPYIDRNTSKASVISNRPGKSSLWEGGKTVSWLISALKDFPKSPEIKNVIVSIGTNGGFGRFTRDDISELFYQLEDKFPNARYLIVQGSWGWGGLKNIEEEDVMRYYSKFERLGGILIEPPIGKIEPHQNHPVYKKIGERIDSKI